MIQLDYKNPEDHFFLQTMAARYGAVFSRPGNGICHYVHLERFAKPWATLVGSDSHTTTAGALGSFALGIGGMDAAVAMSGYPFELQCPVVVRVVLENELQPWVSAKDIILEMLRRHGVKGGRGRIVEYYGEGLDHLTAMDRHVIANMGAELGATTTVFPSDDEVRRFLTTQGRADNWVELVADDGATYDVEEEIELSELEPLIAKPSSPGNVVPVRDVAGEEIHQVVVGSSANPGLRDFGVVALIVDGKQSHPRVSFDINPTSRQTLETLIAMGLLAPLIRAGARLHQSGCMGCIGMGQAPGSGQKSLRTMPRNFPGRSGTPDDLVYLCSPETAAASALTGEITDPRELDMSYPVFREPAELKINTEMLVAPPASGEGIEIVKGPNIASLPEFDPLPDDLELPVLLKVSDDVSTDEIMPAGQRVLPYRSNIPKMSEFVYVQIDDSYPTRALEKRESGHAIVGGHNYGQGSSREHAAIVPRYLGLRVVITKSYARIHWQNLANFGILGLEFGDEADYADIDRDDVLSFHNLRKQLENPDRTVEVENTTKNNTYTLTHNLSARQVEMVLEGGLIPVKRKEL
jgi:aconitate hydratase